MVAKQFRRSDKKKILTVNRKTKTEALLLALAKSIYYVRNVRLRELRELGWLFHGAHLFIYLFS